MSVTENGQARLVWQRQTNAKYSATSSFSLSLYIYIYINTWVYCIFVYNVMHAGHMEHVFLTEGCHKQRDAKTAAEFNTSDECSNCCQE